MQNFIQFYLYTTSSTSKQAYEFNLPAQKNKNKQKRGETEIYPLVQRGVRTNPDNRIVDMSRVQV